MGSGRWGWVVPDGLWEIARPLLPPARMRPQGGGVADIDDETVFAAIIYVLVSGCAWRALPPCFEASKSTVHRRFLIWSRAGVWGRLHQKVLELLDGQNLVDLSRAVLDCAHVRVKKGGEPAGPSPVDRGKPGSKIHVLSDANGLSLRVGLSAANTHEIKTWLGKHPRFHVHFTPTGSSWINQVERWFGLLTDKLIRRGVHTPVKALKDDIRAWIDSWKENPRPFTWTKPADEILKSLADYLTKVTPPFTKSPKGT
ncbi:IS5 family transposase [Streptomyces caelestis]|uniref:IS5 family transposase n=1 Tax=Streptomyces caelestis TaxID=36816 RepID=UPI00364783A0